MVFEPTFDDIEKKSAELPDVDGVADDVDPAEIDRDLAGDSDIGGDTDAIDAAEEGEVDDTIGAPVEADDLPPLGA